MDRVHCLEVGMHFDCLKWQSSERENEYTT